LYKKILVPTDGLVHSLKACQYAIKLAKLTGAEIIGIYVIPSRIVSIFEERRLEGRTAHDVATEYKKNGEAYLRQFQSICSKEHIEVRTILAEGYPPEEILKVAEKEDVDLIVIGVRRKSSIERTVTGKTSDEIVRNAKCPVVIINTPW
jgi:nucleotide-binding universal stress UspA family protein